MKQKISLILFLLFSLSSSFSQNIGGSRVSVFNSDSEALSNAETGWLPGAVRDKIEMNIRTYTDFKLVDSQNEDKIKAIQRKSAGAAYDEDAALEIGKLTTAQYGIFSTIRKTGSTYMLTCDFTDLTTREKKATATILGKKSTDELFNVPGCAVDEVTLKFCDQLGIKLAPIQRIVLEKGEGILSYEERQRQAKLEAEHFISLLSEYDELLFKMKGSAVLSASAERAKLEAERAIAEQKLKAAREKEKRLEQEDRQRKQEALMEAERSSEQKRKRDVMAAQAESLMKSALQGESANLTAISQINATELKKKALVDIRENLEANVLESTKKLIAERDEKIDAVKNRPYKKTELSKGEPTERALSMRTSEIEKINADYADKVQKEADAFRSTSKKQEAELLSEIRKDYSTLALSRTVSSLSEDVKIIVDEYDGNTFAWPVSVYVYSAGISLLNETIDLKYESLPNVPKIPARKATDAEWTEYSESVDLYDSLLRLGCSGLVFEVDYNVQAKSDKFPSEYIFNFSSMRIKSLTANKVIMTKNLSGTSIERKMTPSYDIRTTDEISRDLAIEKGIAEREWAEEQRRIAAQEEKERKEAKKAVREMQARSRRANFKQSAGNGMIRFLGGSILFAEDGTIDGADIDLNFGVFASPYVFSGFSATIFKTPKEIKDVIKGETIGKVFFDLGANLRIPILYYSPNLYVKAGIGCMVGETKDKWKDSRGKEKDTAAYFASRFSAGIDFPITKIFGVYGQANYNIIQDVGNRFDFNAGISIAFPFF